MSKPRIGYDVYNIYCFDILPFLHELSSKGIKVYELKKIEQYRYEFYAITFKRNKVASLDFDIEYIKTIGILNYFRRILTNKVTLVGMVSFIVTYYLLSTFVWRVEIIGSYDNINKQIASLLIYYDISKYDLIKSQDELEIINSDLRHELKGSIDWINTYRYGNIYRIQYTKKYSEEMQQTQYQNLYACRDGVVKQFIVRSGNIIVKPNNYVTAGQILVSNNIVDTRQELKILPVDGRVMANTWYVITAHVDNLDEATSFAELQRLTRLEIQKKLSDYDSIDKEVLISFDISGNGYSMKTHYTLLQNIACK